ncbi:helix-turn-helix transcriptional regulator [Aquimarina gracilis]|uniref:Helix-turn-helix transcriptional regulator n=1 Tax=Aquimarina gracilis TaxID=874422 RepID=A0ABU5ZXU2_9FLAO|nr:helix-turn-helix transcriptional regulator [Aquimarina gracilis]MEB3346671.1 helix-turn-helix transcriptional regulator [Aquimarina gracilis]
MVNSKDFGKRIQKIMDYYAVSASSFADYMGVGRSSISHILSGRNKPSLDFVMKITEAYNEVDLQWLLYGKGVFPKSENIMEKKKTIPENSVPLKTGPAPIEQSDQDLFSQSPSEQKEEIQPLVSKEKIPKIISENNNVDRIVIFYSDGTFNSYQMKKS